MFLMQSGLEVPEESGRQGLVLGTSHGAIALEVSQDVALWLGTLREERIILLRKTRDPDPELLAARQEATKNSVPIYLAPEMRKVSVSLSPPPSDIASWQPGETLILPEAGWRRYWRQVDGTFVEERRRKTVNAVFVDAKPSRRNSVTLTLLVDPDHAVDVISTSMRDGITVIRQVTRPAAKPLKRNRCYVKRRQGAEIVNVEIPCRK